jgi:hypothetical protein
MGGQWGCNSPHFSHVQNFVEKKNPTIDTLASWQPSCFSKLSNFKASNFSFLLTNVQIYNEFDKLDLVHQKLILPMVITSSKHLGISELHHIFILFFFLTFSSYVIKNIFTFIIIKGHLNRGKRLKIGNAWWTNLILTGWRKRKNSPKPKTIQDLWKGHEFLRI